VMPSFVKINVSKPNNWHSSLLICKGSVSDIIQDLGYWKVCTRCVPLNLIVKNKTKRKAICSKLLACSEAEGEACRWKLGPSFRKQGGNPRNSTILNLPGRKNSSISRQGHDHCHLGL
jgi:hypothetical protein